MWGWCCGTPPDRKNSTPSQKPIIEALKRVWWPSRRPTEPLSTRSRSGNGKWKTNADIFRWCWCKIKLTLCTNLKSTSELIYFITFSEWCLIDLQITFIFPVTKSKNSPEIRDSNCSELPSRKIWTWAKFFIISVNATSRQWVDGATKTDWTTPTEAEISILIFKSAVIIIIIIITHTESGFRAARRISRVVRAAAEAATIPCPTSKPIGCCL